MIPKLTFKDKSTYTESSTKQYDMVRVTENARPTNRSIEMYRRQSYMTTDNILKYFVLQLAFKYLSWLLFPLLGGYAVYSLMYVEQKGWYSWVLNMIYGFLLTFGEWFSFLGRSRLSAGRHVHMFSSLWKDPPPAGDPPLHPR